MIAFSKENAAPATTGSGVRYLNKGADLPKYYAANAYAKATAFFWDRDSNSVQPMAALVLRFAQ